MGHIARISETGHQAPPARLQEWCIWRSASHKSIHTMGQTADHVQHCSCTHEARRCLNICHLPIPVYLWSVGFGMDNERLQTPSSDCHVNVSSRATLFILTGILVGTD